MKVDRDPCAECGKPFTDDEWASRHGNENDEDVHERCCRECTRGQTT